VTRADRVAALVAEQELDALLIAHPVNLRYVTGFTGSNGLALVGEGRRVFVTDFRYVEQAADQVPGFDRLRGERDLIDALVAAIPEGQQRIGFDAAHVSVQEHGRLRAALPDRVELVPAAGLIERLRAVKEPHELEPIRAAAALADAVLGTVVERGLVGRSERAVAIDLEHELRLAGADGPSFSSIVASAEHGALPHAEPRDVAIPAGTLVTIDMGARVDGYCSDCTRTFATGPLRAELASAYAVVLDAQQTALAAVAAGRSARETDAIARDIIAAAGHGEHYGHGLGHGVGLDIHEAPTLGQRSDDTLAAGNVVTIEPGIYLPGVGGVRIEDLVVVTADGHEVLSGFAKSLLTVG